MGILTQNLDRLSPEQRLYTLQSLPAHLAAAGKGVELVRALTAFEFLQAKLTALGPDHRLPSRQHPGHQPMSDLAGHLRAMPAEDRQYTLEALVRHLAAARQYARLRTLFAGDGWMRLRFEGRGYQYDSYLTDLAVAWDQVAHPAAIGQAEGGQEPAGLVDCVRYALIRTSVNSIAANYSHLLVTQAVCTGLWPPLRAAGPW